jgi:hypothetical protein
MQIIKDKIFIIENFISENTSKFLVDNFSKNLKNTERNGIYTSIGKGEGQANKISLENKIAEYDGDNNIAIDILTSLCASMEKTMSTIYKKNMILKSVFYSHMKTGGENPLHYDTYKEDYANDYSGMLYLTDTYTGGALHFPDKEITLRPDPGTFVSFFGTEDMKHEVKKVTSGDRVNLICFFNESGV